MIKHLASFGPLARPLKAAFALTLITALGGCVMPPTVEQEALTKDVSYLLAINSGLRKKIAALEESSQLTAKKVANLERNLSTLDDETKSAVAEYNAELDRFREEFSFVQGGVEETGFMRERFREEIDELRAGLKAADQGLINFKDLMVSAEQRAKFTNQDIVDAVNAISNRLVLLEEQAVTLGEKSKELETQAKEIDRKTAHLEDRFAILEPKKKKEKKISKMRPRTLYMQGYQFATNKNYPQALETLSAFLEHYPKHKLAAEARFWLAETHYAMAAWEKALLEYDTIIKKHPKSDRVALSMYKQALSFDKLKARKEAKILLGRVIEFYPGTEAATEAQIKLDEFNGVKKPKKSAPKDAKKEKTETKKTNTKE